MALATDSIKDEIKGQRPIKPRVLKKGDTVGIVTPASAPFEPGMLKFAVDWLSSKGLKYKLGPNAFKSYSSYAGSDAARAEDMNAVWADEQVAAVLPFRGGAGASRILPDLDFALFASQPKIICGFSDITALLLAIHQKSGLVTFHGPTLNLIFDSAYTESYFHKAVMTTQAVGLITDPPVEDPWGIDYPPPRMVICEGKAKGRLTGGCMTLIRGLMGTPWEIETENRIVFLEDVEEEPHSIDRMLTQLLLAGKLDKAAGLIIGDCAGCRPGGSKRNVLPLNMPLETILRERLGHLDIPVVYGLKLGHTVDKVTLPLGVTASLSATASGVRFKLEEAACSDKAQGLKK